MISVRKGIIAPFQQPKRKDSQSSTARSLPKDGAATSHDIAGYAETSANRPHATRIGRRPMRSDSAPESGSHKRFVRPTQRVTMKLSFGDIFRTCWPNVGVYAVIV